MEALCELVMRLTHAGTHIDDLKDITYYILWYGIWKQISMDMCVSISERNAATVSARQARDHVLRYFAKMKNWDKYSSVLNALYGYSDWKMPEENTRSEECRMKTDI